MWLEILDDEMWCEAIALQIANELRREREDDVMHEPWGGWFRKRERIEFVQSLGRA